MITKFKKPIALLLAVTMAMLLNFPSGLFGIDLGLKASAAGITPTEPKTDGNGVYQIGTAEELYGFAALVNGGTKDANAVLTADITVNSDLLGSLEYDTLGDVKNGKSFTAWTPIGNENNRYTGTFDGQGHTISGLFNKTQENYVGLFGYVGNGGHVLNVGVVDSYFSGSQCVGGVCGYNYGGTIKNCYNTGKVSNSSKVGGVCGENSGGTIESCYNTGSVNGYQYVGGVCGWNHGTIENCYSAGAVSGSKYVGGVCGWNDLGKITNCYYDSNNYGRDAVGYIDGGTIKAVEGKTTALFTDGTICALVKYHSHQNGICILCGNYKPATKTTDKYDINGDDIKDEVYEISNAGQLYWFAGLVNGDERVCDYNAESNTGTKQNPSANAVLTADITVNKDVLKSDGTLTDAVSGFKSWTPIGYYKSPSNFKSYTGTFDGHRHTISGLYFNDTNIDYVGLFGYVGNGGRVLNVGVVDSYFSGSNLVGGVCGYNKGKITNCYNEGTVSGSSGSNYVGGVCGDNEGTIEKCYNTGSVSGSGDSSGSNYVGGVCGYNKGSGKITNCYNKGKVSGGAASKVGGVCGWNYGTIENCYSTGAVSGGNEYVGGVCGDNGGTIEKCYNTGSVSGVESVGGVCGHNKGSGKITNCYNEGTVSGSSNYVGGVCGHNEGGTITNCYNTVSISNSSYYVGGVCGWNDSGTITNCYYLAESETDRIDGTTFKNTTEFASGEVAYLLQSAQTADAETGKIPMVWGQTLGGKTPDAYPVFYNGNTVYGGYADCNATDKTYSNSALHETKGHKYDGVNHACSYCGNAFAAIEVNYAKLANALTEDIYNVDSNGNIGDKANVTVDTDTGVVTCLIKVNGNKDLIDTYTLNISASENVENTASVQIGQTKYKKTSGEKSINIDMVQLVNELEVGSYTATLTLYGTDGKSICNIDMSFTVRSEASLAE